jgi:glycosyltransferase involved in cell wall biosynthesis
MNNLNIDSIRDRELQALRSRVELQQRTIETMRESLNRAAVKPRSVTIEPCLEQAKPTSSLPQPVQAISMPWWPALAPPKSGLRPPAGPACQSLDDADVTAIAFAVFGLGGEALDKAVSNVAERQRVSMNFVPVFLTDCADHGAFRRRGYVFEYFPKALYESLASGPAFQDKMFVAWKKWGVGSLIDLGSNDYLRSRLAGTRVPELAAVISRSVAEQRSAAVPFRSGKARPSAEVFGGKLWAGFSRPALRELEKLKRSSSKAEQVAAAWELARWYAYHGEHQRALDHVGLMRAVDAKRSRSKNVLLLETESLLHLGHRVEARTLVEAGLSGRDGFDADLCLVYANTFAGSGETSADESRLAWINRVFLEGGFAPIEKADPGRPLTIDNLAAPTALRADIPDAPKASVIMPVFNASDTVGIALESLLAQTWPNLEIVVVDDHSTDGTSDIVRTLARKHQQIVPVRLGRNQGAYAARNEGLRHVSGDMIMTHDSDDWSHPQQIEAQMRALIMPSRIMGTFSSWSRTTRDLYFTGPWRPGAARIDLNYSSLLFRRDAMESLGAWDKVRVAADREFIKRFETVFGAEALIQTHEKVPLAFALKPENSLTSVSDTHIGTVLYGIRRTYHEAADWWRETVTDPDLFKFEADQSRPRSFPAPRRIHPDKSAASRYDYLFITDFNLSGGAFTSVMNDVKACLLAGKRVALFHWPRFDMNVESPLPPQVWELAAGGNLDVISAGESLEADTVIAGYPAILQHPIDNPPQVNFNRLIVIVCQTAFRLLNDQDQAYDPKEVRRTLMETFGTEGIWVPVSGLVGRLITAHGDYPPPHPEPWPPLLDVTAFTGEPVWRGAVRDKPVIGRHGRDHYSKWPSNRDALLDAYCAGRPCSVRILGGADKALKVIGALPSNWEVQPFNSLPIPDFLGDIDFFVHYPHEEYVEAFGMVVAEAMAAGKPAILPPIFEETFGSSALYAEPSAVWETVAHLWRSESAYLDRAIASREFARSNYALERFGERVLRLRNAYLMSEDTRPSISIEQLGG